MSLIRRFVNPNTFLDHQGSIINADITYGALNASGLFQDNFTAAESISFWRDNAKYTMLPQTDRVGKKISVGTDPTGKMHSLALPYWDHQETLTKRDIANQLNYKNPTVTPKTKAEAKAIKTKAMLKRADQTREYMKLEAIKGVTKDGEGNVLFDAFAEFNQTQVTVDLLLGTTTSVNARLQELTFAIGDNNRTGQDISMPTVIMGRTLFTNFTTHADMEVYYGSYANSGTQVLRDSLFQWTGWGASGEFYHQGIRFICYEPSFFQPDGTVVSPIAPTEGYLLLPNHDGLYKAFHGPSEKYSAVGSVGAPMFMHEWLLDRDEGEDLELEFATLYMMTNPLLSVRVISST